MGIVSFRSRVSLVVLLFAFGCNSCVCVLMCSFYYYLVICVDYSLSYRKEVGFACGRMRDNFA